MRVKKGGFCCYCKRGPLLASGGREKLSFTWDHINPRARGGGRKVPCCRHCNQLKGDLHPAQWFWFVDAHPSYWRDFKTAREVLVAINAEKMRRSRQGEPPVIYTDAEGNIHVERRTSLCAGEDGTGSGQAAAGDE